MKKSLLLISVVGCLAVFSGCNSGRDQANAVKDQAKQQADNIQQQANNQADAIKDAANAKSNDLKAQADALKDKASDVKDQANKQADQVQQKGKDQANQVEQAGEQKADAIHQTEKQSSRHASTGAVTRNQVRAYQQDLKNLGFLSGNADGLMGPKTHAAISKFQKNRNLTVTGQLDVRTQELLSQNAGQAGK